MQNYSITYVGIIVMFLSALFKSLGIEIGTAELTTTVTTIGVIAGALVGLYGRWRKGDLNLFGSRKR